MSSVQSSVDHCGGLGLEETVSGLHAGCAVSCGSWAPSCRDSAGDTDLGVGRVYLTTRARFWDGSGRRMVTRADANEIAQPL